MENTSDSFMPRPLLFCLKSGRSVCYSVPDNTLRTWTQEHGFSSATGAQFMEPMLVRFSEEKYSMDCQLLFADGGNGIQPEDVQTKLTMDYFKEKKLLQIHP